MKPKKGPVIIFVPAKLLANWVQEWFKFIDESNEKLQMKLLVGYGSPVKGATQLRNSDYIDNLRSPLIEGGNSLPQEGQERYVVLTTVGSYDRQVSRFLKHFIHKGKPAKGLGSRSKTPPPDVYSAVSWGRLFRDEFHEQKNSGTAALNVIQNIPGMPYRWFLSGTPFEVSPMDISAYMRTLESASWQTHDQLRSCTTEAMSKLSSEFATLSRRGQTGEEFDKVATSFRRVLQQLMIRRTDQSKWFGKPVVELPPHESRDIQCPLLPRYLPMVKELEQRGRNVFRQIYKQATKEKRGRQKKGKFDVQKMAMNLYYRSSISHKLRLIASFPALVDFVSDLGMELTWEELRSYGLRDEDLDKTPYIQHLDDIIASSSKATEIRQLVDSLKTDYLNRPEKLVILTCFPTAVILLYRVSVFNKKVSSISLILDGSVFFRNKPRCLCAICYS
jgi:SNF2 family DNA or RNA helicase